MSGSSNLSLSVITAILPVIATCIGLLERDGARDCGIDDRHDTHDLGLIFAQEECSWVDAGIIDD